MEVREKGWRDIRSAYFTMMLLSSLDIGGWLSKKLDDCAKHDDAPRDKYRWRDVMTATLATPARKTEELRAAMTTSYSPILMVAGLGAGVTSGFYAASATWALLAGKGALAGIAGLAAGVATAPLVATAIGVGCSILLPMIGASLMFWPKMLSDGLREAGLCRKYAVNPPKRKAAPGPKKPPVTDQLESHLRIVGAEDSAARVDFFRSLRKRFPEEFNEAATLDAHAPILRGPVTVKSPLKFRTPAKAPDTEGGAA